MKTCSLLLALGIATLAFASPARASTLQSAEVTVAINKVLMAEPGADPRPAKPGNILAGRASLETGEKSRAELTFNDRTIARLGANSVFSFSKGTREMEMNRGVMLLQVPKNAGGATIQAGAVTAAVTGTTIALEFSPKSGSSPAAFKLLCLEGTVRAFKRGVPGESVLLGPGQLLVYNMQGKLPDPVIFDVARLVKTSGLLSKNFAPLPSWDLIQETISEQRGQLISGKLILSNFTLNQQLPPSLQIVQASNFMQQARILSTQSPPAPPPAPKPPPPPPPPAPTPPPPPPPDPDPNR